MPVCWLLAPVAQSELLSQTVFQHSKVNKFRFDQNNLGDCKKSIPHLDPSHSASSPITLSEKYLNIRESVNLSERKFAEYLVACHSLTCCSVIPYRCYHFSKNFTDSGQACSVSLILLHNVELTRLISSKTYCHQHTHRQPL